MEKVPGSFETCNHVELRVDGGGNRWCVTCGDPVVTDPVVRPTVRAARPCACGVLAVVFLGVDGQGMTSELFLCRRCASRVVAYLREQLDAANAVRVPR